MKMFWAIYWTMFIFSMLGIVACGLLAYLNPQTKQMQIFVKEYWPVPLIIGAIGLILIGTGVAK